MVCKETMHSQILEAARKRFVHYGYGKTTMAEIAADLNMSPGNLYRYFPGKADIAEAIADESAEENFRVLREIVRTNGGKVREKLLAMFERELELTFHKLDKDRRIYEMAEFIRRERPHYINKHLATERQLLVDVLDEGLKSGEFAFTQDPAFVAEMLQSAMLKFRYPQLWSALPMQALKRELAGVFELLVDGITPRAPRKSANDATAAKGVAAE
ncbi:MAG: TetR/AcrR family transcriptional regulator [Alphaproteobacteria bacterium]|nr:TetR/AcrR family transcriptional regulator [Alphaproteobacteria bacterium]